jgi:tetratricopeptide (TPR) repeat protein
MSDGADSVAHVGDLLTFTGAASRPGAGPHGGDPGLGLGSRPRFGLRRGTAATGWYDAGCRLESTDPAAAIAAYERAATASPGLADAYNNLGRLHHDAGQRAVAESSYRLAICADPSVALYWFNLGVAVEDQGRSAEAIAAYGEAIARDARLGDAHFNLARLLELGARRAGDDVMLRRAVRHLLRYRELACTGVSAR